VFPGPAAERIGPSLSSVRRSRDHFPPFPSYRTSASALASAYRCAHATLAARIANRHLASIPSLTCCTPLPTRLWGSKKRPQLGGG